MYTNRIKTFHLITIYFNNSTIKRQTCINNIVKVGKELHSSKRRKEKELGLFSIA